MSYRWLIAVGLMWSSFFSTATAEVTVSTTAELVAAVNRGEPGETILLSEGTYRLTAPLEPKAGMTLTGAGIEKTIITHEESWQPATELIPDSEVNTRKLDSHAYLIRLQDKADRITLSHFTLLGPHMHGAVFGLGNQHLHLHHVRIQDTLWSGLRTFHMKTPRIHDCEFIDAGGKWKRGGQPGVDGGISGGGIFAVWMQDCEIAHNRFTRTKQGPENNYFGIKGRGGRNCRIHHNTIRVNFSIEFPFEGNADMEIDHNVLDGVISIPKYAGGKVPESGTTFHIHHNWMTTSYAIEFVRNGVEIDHNLFDFDVEQDKGNLISGFGRAPASGPAKFHHNLVKNPGRGVIWINEIYNHFDIDNNHIKTRTTVTPRQEGLFGFNGGCDFSTIRIRNNIIECEGIARPLLRHKNSYQAVIQNNQLSNISDSDRYENPDTDEAVGLEKPLEFRCGVHQEFRVQGWSARRVETMDDEK